MIKYSVTKGANKIYKSNVIKQTLKINYLSLKKEKVTVTYSITCLIPQAQGETFCDEVNRAWDYTVSNIQEMVKWV